MVIIMDASTGERETEAEYGDEVLNAGWLPQPEVSLQLQSAVPAHPHPHPHPHPHRNITDPDSFLRNMYACQE